MQPRFVLDEEPLWKELLIGLCKLIWYLLLCVFATVGFITFIGIITILVKFFWNIA